MGNSGVIKSLQLGERSYEWWCKKCEEFCAIPGVGTEVLEEVLQLHKKYAPSDKAFDLIAGHCVIVAQLARDIASNHSCLNINRKSIACDAKNESHGDTDSSYEVCAPNAQLIIGALVHDIGTYAVLDSTTMTDADTPRFIGEHYITHGIRGYEILRDNGFSEDIAQFARNHTGVGLRAQDVTMQNLPIPVDDYVPLTINQEIVMYADKFHSKSVPSRFISSQTARARCAKFGEDNIARWDVLVERYGLPDSAKYARAYSMEIV